MSGIDIDPESNQIREVFANFGLASYQAQCLEKQIAILLSYTCARTPDKMTKARADDLLDTNLEQSFGALIKQLKSRTVLPNDISEKLERAIEGRNWLAHHCWWDRASEFNTCSGRKKMLTELIELATLFDELDEFFISVVKDWAINKGLTQDDFDASLKDLLSAPTPPRKKKRKLNKEEILVGVYSYTTDKGELMLFELEDHTLWALCDCGLTYGPEEPNSQHLRPIHRFNKSLPAVINPRPRGAEDWNYTIKLSTGFYIRVSPSEKNGKYSSKLCLIHKP